MRHIPRGILKSLMPCGERGPRQDMPAAPKDPGPLCEQCAEPIAGHPSQETMCQMLASALQERDALIAAIEDHARKLQELGFGLSPDDKALFDALPVWARKVMS